MESLRTLSRIIIRYLIIDVTSTVVITAGMEASRQRAKREVRLSDRESFSEERRKDHRRYENERRRRIHDSPIDCT